MGKLRVLLVFFVVAALLWCFTPTTVGACAPGPCYWIGSAKVEDAWVPAGTEISAWINGVQVGETTTGSLPGYDAWEFRIMVPSDDPATPGVEGGSQGDMVQFKIKRPGDVGWLEAAIDPATKAIFVWGDPDFAWHGVLLTAGNPPPATLEGQVHLQGRPTPPDPTWETPLRVVFFAPGTNTILREENITTDQEGSFTISDVASDIYDIGVKCPRSLSELVPDVAFPGGATVPVDFGTLREGDANNDDATTGLDCALLWFYFGQTSVEALEKCDFNRDGVVSGLDYSLLWTNFGQKGDMWGM